MEPNILKSFCAAKETINKTKRQTTEMDKIFAHGMTNKGLTSNTLKLKCQKKKKRTLKKWAENQNRPFSKRKYRWLP